MKLFNNTLLFAALMSFGAATLGSCSDKGQTGGEDSTGTVTGMVRDEGGSAIQGVTVEITGVGATAVTDSDGSYAIADVDVIARRLVTFSKAGYRTVEITLKAADFAGGVATVNATLQAGEGTAVITGTVTDAAANPLDGVTVSVSGMDGTVTTAGDGTYTVENVSVIAVRTVTFSKAGYLSVEKSVVAADFIDNTAVVDAALTKLLTITGTVADRDGNPVEDVQISVSGVDAPVLSAADGTYAVENIPLAETLMVTFSKDDYQTVEQILTSADFTDSATRLDIVLTQASSQITGMVVNSVNGNPVSGAMITVSSVAGGAITTTTAADGTFTFGSILEGDYTVTFTKAGYPDVTLNVSASDFVEGTADLGTVYMESQYVLPDKTLGDLLEGAVWLYNDYKSGANAPAGAAWSEFSSYLYGLADLYGRYEYQTEGLCVRIRVNSDGSLTADTDNFDSYMYGRKLITADNKTLTLKVRTHDTTDDSPAEFGVQVIDPSAAVPAAVKVGANRTCNSSVYQNYDFDLSDYIGREVIIAIGIYRAKDGSDYLPQLPIRAVAFTPGGTGSDDAWMSGSGTEVAYGWKLTREMVSSTMVQTRSSFTGITPGSGSNAARYRSWYPADVPHIAKEWGMIAVGQEPEPFPGEGFMLKSRNATLPAIDASTPENYFYAKFSIGQGRNKLSIRARTFSSTKNTYFRVSSVSTADYSLTHFRPTSVTNATVYEITAESLVGFSHENGGADSAEGYALFEYDLSPLDGTDAVIIIGVYRSTTADDKMSFYSIEMN